MDNLSICRASCFAPNWFVPDEPISHLEAQFIDWPDPIQPPWDCISAWPCHTGPWECWSQTGMPFHLLSWSQVPLCLQAPLQWPSKCYPCNHWGCLDASSNVSCRLAEGCDCFFFGLFSLRYGWCWWWWFHEFWVEDEGQNYRVDHASATPTAKCVANFTVHVNVHLHLQVVNCAHMSQMWHTGCNLFWRSGASYTPVPECSLRFFAPPVFLRIGYIFWIVWISSLGKVFYWPFSLCTIFMVGSLIIFWSSCEFHCFFSCALSYF